MSGGWTIEQACPQCGAQVEFDEADRILSCRFCRVRHYLMPRDRFRYILPAAKAVPVDELFYAPYWRFRGMACTCHAYDIDSRVIDTSLCGAGLSGFPQTLGVRPQAMKLHFAQPEKSIRYMPLKLTTGDFAGYFADQFMRSTEKIFFRECIGESVSLIYAPFFVDGGRLYDGVLKREVELFKKEPFDAAAISLDTPNGWDVSFLPTLCPNCGWDMLAEKESCVLLCPKCSRAWQPSAGHYKPAAYVVMKSEDAAAQYLPFWRMRATIEGLQLENKADLIKFANMPTVAVGDSAQKPLLFWAPAFKIQPQVFFRLSRQVLAQQPCGETHDRLDGLDLHPVTLPAREAAESIKISLALLAARRKDVYPALSRLKVRMHGCELVYIPFTVTAQEFINEQFCLAIGRTALNFGRSI